MNIKDIKVAFEHTAGEIEIIIAGLRKLPMEVVQELHDRMIKEANAKIQETQNTPEAPNEQVNQ
jgi:hypothetical protein